MNRGFGRAVGAEGWNSDQAHSRGNVTQYPASVFTQNGGEGARHVHQSEIIDFHLGAGRFRIGCRDDPRVMVDSGIVEKNLRMRRYFCGSQNLLFVCYIQAHGPTLPFEASTNSFRAAVFRAEAYTLA